MSTRTRRRTAPIAAALATSLAFALTGCAADGSGPSLPSLDGASVMDNALSRLTGDWSLDALRRADVTGLVPEGVRRPTLTIGDDGGVSGFAGVNRFTGSLDPANLARGDFDLSPAAMTRMAGPDEAMSLEREFMDALNSVASFDASALADGVLRLLNEQGAELLRFVRPV